MGYPLSDIGGYFLWTLLLENLNAQEMRIFLLRNQWSKASFHRQELSYNLLR